MVRPFVLLRHFLWLGIILFAPLAPFGAVAAASEADGLPLLRAAWVAVGTGQITAAPPRQRVDTPVDLQLIDAAAVRAGVGIAFVPMGRAAAEAALADGTVDLLFPSADGAGPVSRPYRTKRDVLLCQRDLPALGVTGVPALAAAYGRGWRIGFLRGAPYPPDIEALAAAHPDATVRFGHAGLALANVAEGTAHCLLAPRLTILAALAATHALERHMARQPVAIAQTALFLRFAASVPPESIAALDAALGAMQDEGTALAIEDRASLPVLFRFAVAISWFAWLDAIGTIAFALSGVLIARAEGFSLLGAFVLAALPAVGGGVLRDVLVGRSPIGILGDPLSLLLVAGTVMIAYVAGAMARRLAASRKTAPRRLPRTLSPMIALEVTDAIGLAAFTVIGVSVAVRTGAEPLWLWGPLLAALSGAGGGILRDLLRSGYENPALRTSFYAEVCVLWGLGLSLAILFLLPAEQPALIRLMVALTVLGAFATRLTVVAFKLRSPRF